jgi:hypothetical protein
VPSGASQHGKVTNFPNWTQRPTVLRTEEQHLVPLEAFIKNRASQSHDASYAVTETLIFAINYQ